MTRLWADGSPIQVDSGADGLPVAFTWRGRRHIVANITLRWRVRADWWTEEAWREYVKVTTTDGLLCMLYHDLHGDAWFCARLYD